MVTVYAIHAPFAEKLREVVEEMKILGAPTVKVVDCGDHYMALEGSHRLAAASELDLQPRLEVYHLDDVIKISEFDWYDSDNWAEENYACGEVVGELFSFVQAVSYNFDIERSAHLSNY